MEFGGETRRRGWGKLQLGCKVTELIKNNTKKIMNAS